MFKKILNEAWITFKIEATGPILIKAGETQEETKIRQQREEGTPKMVFVIDANEEIFIPGSSIKGVWRSWCEKIARTLSNEVPPLSCDPLCENDKSEDISCSKRLEEIKKKNPVNAYALSCPICKLFGNTSLGSRIKFSDAYLSDKGSRNRVSLPKRDGIAINRFTGGVERALFNYQYILNRKFISKIQIRNFELWQLGLLAFLLRDFEEELVPIGYGKTRGLGKVKGTIDSMSLCYYGFNKPEIDNAKANITGVGGLFGDPENNEGYYFDNEAPIGNINIENCINGPIKTILELNQDQAKELMNRSAPYWAEIIDNEPGGYSVRSQSIRKGLIDKL